MLWQDDTAFLERLLLSTEFVNSTDVRLEGESQPKLWKNMQVFPCMEKCLGSSCQLKWARTPMCLPLCCSS